MSLEPFSKSEALTFGVELELQLVNRHDYDLASASPDLLRMLKGKEYPGDIKPEITDSMIEISTGICHSHDEALWQLREMRDRMAEAATALNIGICGGGTHPFQQWSQRQISQSPRYQYISDLYGYLAKQFTVFGQHVHIGCPNPDDALYLLHAMSRYVPHFIALAASSPFVQGVDTGFASARMNSVSAFPMSGRAPFVLTWDAFIAYFDKMHATGVIESMKDFYWDIRPKPEFGTIEVRVMDTPLTVERAAAIAAYI
ncbi:MAG: glutamate--cysteine ligase, partial [Actinobacteria bacterium]|nr:glutamate--cysteine ligase [Actinomycetota bacterium]